MAATNEYPAVTSGPWDEEHAKALLRFPRFPARLIQQEPWQSWVSERGGLAAVYTYLQNYPLSPNHRRILDIVLANPEAIAEVYATRLNVSRATYFYQLRELVPILVQALNHWQTVPIAAPVVSSAVAPPFLINLPTPLTSLIGAESSLDALMPTLLNQDVRLLTLLGPGGIGKTRLGIELAKRLADQFADGVFFVDLTTLNDVAYVAPTIAHALGLNDVTVEQGEAQLKTYLRDRTLLLVLDNFEHLLSAALVVTDLLAVAPGLKILVTSRVALHVYGEYEYVVPPLPIPRLESLKEPRQLAQSPSATLFIERARSVNAAFSLNPENFKAVAELCVQMEGLPLAIELAASQIKYFSPQALLIRISNSHRLPFLSHGLKRLSPRQQTLRGMLDWSYMLLTPDLQILFCRLGVFAGGCTIDAVAEVCAESKFPSELSSLESPAVPEPVEIGLTALVDQSLLRQQNGPGGEPRFEMLGITREYALERVASRNELTTLQRNHARYYLSLAEQFGESADDALPLAKVELFRREYANYQTAIQWALDTQAGDLALRFIAALWEFWKYSGYQREARQMTQTALDQTVANHSSIYARVQRLVGWLAHDVRDFTTMQRSFQISLEICESSEERREVGLSLLGLAELAQLRGQWEQANEQLQQCRALFSELGEQKHAAWARLYLGRVAFGRGDLQTAQHCFRESLEAFQASGSARGRVHALAYLGQCYLCQGQATQATSILEECRSVCNAIDESRSAIAAHAANYLAECALNAGRLGQARELAAASLSLSKEAGYSAQIELGSYTFALLAMRERRGLSAARCLRDCLLLQQLLKEQWRSLILLDTVAELIVATGDLLGAARLYGAAEQLRAALNLPRLPIYQAQHERSQQQLKQQLDTASLYEAWSAGQSLSLDQAIAYALRCVE